MINGNIHPGTSHQTGPRRKPKAQPKTTARKPKKKA